jgi:uncharacterized protein CbrC (UPF0167 family)
MSLRASDRKVFEIVCDTCGVKTAISLMPVEAEIRAAEGGWRTERNPLRHVCPWCIEKGSPPLSVIPPSSHTTSPTAGR